MSDVINEWKMRREAEDIENLKQIVDESVDVNSDFFKNLVEAVNIFSIRGFKTYVETTGKKISPEIINSFWPDKLRKPANEELTLVDQIRCFLLIRYVFEGIAEQTGGVEKTQKMLPHLAPDVQIPSTDAVEAFVIKYQDKFDAKAIAQIARVDESQIDSGARESALVSCMRSSRFFKTLPLLNINRPMVVLENFRGYVSCEAAEKILIENIQKNKVSVLTIQLEDGQATLVIMYIHVTIAACFNSTSKMFENDCMYVPIGPTREFTESIKDKDQTLIDARDSSKGIQQIWAKSRKINMSKQETKDCKDQLGIK